MASFTKRNGKWRVRLSFKDADGNFKTKSKQGFETKKEAQAFAATYEVNENSNLTSKLPKTVPEYFWNWFETYKESTIVDRTKLQYKHTYNVLDKYFHNLLITDLTRQKYQKFLDEYGKDHAKETVVKINALFHACIKDAVYDKDIEKDVLQRTNIVYNKEKTWKIEYLNQEELKKLTNHLINTRNHHYSSKYMILLALFTGMRLGEIQGLKWEDINFDFKSIRIRRSWNSLQKKYVPTKNESSNRTIRVNSEMLELLKELKTNNSEAVFINQFGTIPTSNAVNKTLRKVLDELDINRQGFHFHSLRHTHVAYLLSQKIDIYIISKRLGHSDVGTTTRVYSYLIDEYRDRANDEIENSISKLIGQKTVKNN